MSNEVRYGEPRRLLRKVVKGNSLIVGVIIAAVMFALFDSCEKYEDEVYYIADTSLCVGCEICLDVCQEDAISMVDGKAVIDESKCIGCGKCAQECVVDAIYLNTQESPSSGSEADTTTTDTTTTDTSSGSTSTGGTVYTIVSSNCVGCGACPSSCPKNAISMEDGKAVIDASLCVGCGKCVSACNFEAIVKEE